MACTALRTGRGDTRWGSRRGRQQGVMVIMMVLLLGAAVVVSATERAVGPTVTTECGPVTGVWDARRNVAAFLGVPYALPPTKSLRWQPAVPISRGQGCWSGTLAATSFGAACPQLSPYPKMSEDCLFLNVWTPNASGNKSGAALPVMLFLHGGSYVMGSGSFDGAQFVNKTDGQVILVSINYRLNALGFMALEALSRKDSRGVSGNYGVTDMVAALQWVKKNIAAFGGNPNSVTVFGQSSGGTGVLMLLTTPSAKGLFHRAILESASTRIDMSLKDAYSQNKIFVKNTNCNTSHDVYACLMDLSTEQILKSTPWDEWPFYNHPTDMDIPIFEKGPGAMLGIVDGVTIPLPSDQALLAGLYNDVPVIIGTNDQEIDFAPAVHLEHYSIAQYEDYIRKRFSAWGPDFGERVLDKYDVIKDYGGLVQKAYESIASDIHATCGQLVIAKNAAMGFKSPVFHYTFGQDPSHPFCLDPNWCAKYALHALEMFMLLDDYSVYMPTNYTTHAADQQMGDILRYYWVYFATHGDTPPGDKFPKWWPINGPNVHWPVDYNTYRLTLPPTAQKGWKREQCEFWNANGFYAFNWNS